MEALFFVAAGALLAVAVLRAGQARLWLTARRRARARQVECTGCGRELPARKALSIGQTFTAHDGGMGGTSSTTDWHRRCARRAGVA